MYTTINYSEETKRFIQLRKNALEELKEFSQTHLGLKQDELLHTYRDSNLKYSEY